MIDENIYQKSLMSYIQKEIIKNLKKIKGKFPPLSEIVDRTTKILPIKAVYDLSSIHKNFYLFIIKNYSKQPKRRYFLAITLAFQSSDLLVSLARDYIRDNKELKLIQYSIHPVHHRVNLLLMKELTKIKDYEDSIELLIPMRQSFRKKLDKIKTFLENK